MMKVENYLINQVFIRHFKLNSYFHNKLKSRPSLYRSSIENEVIMDFEKEKRRTNPEEE
jgi:hypothetical protein